MRKAKIWLLAFVFALLVLDPALGQEQQGEFSPEITERLATDSSPYGFPDISEPVVVLG